MSNECSCSHAELVGACWAPSLLRLSCAATCVLAALTGRFAARTSLPASVARMLLLALRLGYAAEATLLAACLVSPGARRCSHPLCILNAPDSLIQSLLL